MTNLEIGIFVAGLLVGSICTWLMIVSRAATRSSITTETWKPGQAVMISPQVEQLALEPNRKIQAIKVLREENPGIGLAEAKSQVEALQRRIGQIAGQMPYSGQNSYPASEASPSHPGLNIPSEVRLLLQQGRMIEAIKMIRATNQGVGLAEAKAIVDEMMGRK